MAKKSGKPKNPIIAYYESRGRRYDIGGPVAANNIPYQGIPQGQLDMTLAPMNTSLPAPSVGGMGGNPMQVVSGAAGLVGGIMSNAQNTGDLSDTYSGIADQFSGAQGTDFDSLTEEWSAFTPVDHVSWRDVRGGSGGAQGLLGTTAMGAAAGSVVPGIGNIIGGGIGLIGGALGNLFGKKKAKKKARKINKRIDRANVFAVNDLINRADTLDTEQNLDVMANYSAYGGPLNLFRSGGGIHIKPSRRGTFKAQASRMGMSVQQAASKILSAPKGKYSPAMRKKANFARNFAGKKHGYGGYMFFPDDFTEFNTGGTHEESPLGGIPQGVDAEGNPNLVEEGESRYKDYVFSDRLFIDGDMLKPAGLPSSLKGKTFSQAARYMAEESKERPNDPISKRSMRDAMTKLMILQEGLRASLGEEEGNSFAIGGDIPPARSWNSIDLTPDLYRTSIPASPRASSWNAIDLTPSPVPAGIPGSGLPSSSWKSIDLGGTPFTTYSAPQGKNTTPARKTPSRRNDLRESMSVRDLGIQPLENSLQFPELIASPGPLDNQPVQGGRTREGLGIDESYLRYAPVLGSAIGAFMDNGPDYRNIDRMEKAVQRVDFDPVGNYLVYTPLDRNYYLNKLDAQAGATRRGVVNQSAGNRSTAMAGLLAADYNYGNAMGQLARQAEEYNLGQRERVEAFNRGTNQFNSEGKLKADTFNAELGLKAAMAAAQMREAERLGSDAAKSSNLTRFFDNLGEIGREATGRNMINFNPAQYYSIDRSGKISYKGMDELTDEEKEMVRKAARKKAGKRARGGFLTI